MNKYLLGILVLVVLTSSVYIFFPENVRLDIGSTYSTFKVWENGEWITSGQEYTILYDGTAKMRANSRTVETFINDNKTTIIRTANFKDNITAIDTYVFDGNIKDIELFPISHNVRILNGEGKIFLYEVTKLLYTGETINGITSPQSYGHKMKIEWEAGNYYSRIYKYANKDEGKLSIRYKLDEPEESFEVRLFDPWWNTDWINCRNITLTEANGLERVNEVMRFNLTGLTLSNATKEVRIVDGPCDVGGNELTSQVISSDDSTWAEVLFLANASASGDTIYSVYYNYPSATVPSYSDMVTLAGNSSHNISQGLGQYPYNLSLLMNSLGSGYGMEVEGTELTSSSDRYIWVLSGGIGKKCSLIYDGVLEAKYVCDATNNSICASDEICQTWYFNPSSFDMRLNKDSARKYFRTTFATTRNFYFNNTNAANPREVTFSNGYLTMNNSNLTNSEVYFLWNEDLNDTDFADLVGSASYNQVYLFYWEGIVGTNETNLTIRTQIDGKSTNYNTDGQNWETKFDNPLSVTLGTEETGTILSLNLSYGPPNTDIFRFGICSSSFENSSAIPQNQTNTYGIDYICNNGTATSDVQIKLSGALNTGWTWYASNESDFIDFIKGYSGGLTEGSLSPEIVEATVFNFVNVNYVNDSDQSTSSNRINYGGSADITFTSINFSLPSVAGFNPSYFSFDARFLYNVSKNNTLYSYADCDPLLNSGFCYFNFDSLEWVGIGPATLSAGNHLINVSLPDNAFGDSGEVWMKSGEWFTGSGDSVDFWEIWITYNPSFAFSPLTTSYQTIHPGLAVDACTYIWHIANCSYVTQNPGAYEQYQGV